MTEELKPCPFCGGTDVNFIEAYDDEGLTRVACNACSYTSGMAMSYNTATQEWNGLCARVAPLRASVADFLRQTGEWIEQAHAVFLHNNAALLTGEELREVPQPPDWRQVA